MLPAEPLSTADGVGMPADEVPLPVWVYVPPGFGHALAGRLSALLAGPAPVLRLLEAPSPARLEEQPWLPVTVQPPLILIGPVAVRGRAPCPQCLRVRRLQHGLASGADVGTDTDAGPVPDARITETTAALVIALIDDYVRHQGQGGSGELVHVVDAESGRVSAWPVAPVHGCRLCAGSASGAEVTACARDLLRELHRAASPPR